MVPHPDGPAPNSDSQTKSAREGWPAFLPGKGHVALGQSAPHGVVTVPAAAVPESSTRSSGMQVTRLLYGGWLACRSDFVDPLVAGHLAHALLDQVCFEQRSIRLFGRSVAQPRLVAWAGELPYRYSGQTLEPRARPECLQELWHRLERAAGVRFNHVLINRYRNGNDSMGWHADDEPELGRDPPIASVSLGQERRFVLRPRARQSGLRQRPLELRLTHGSLLIMGGSLQHHYQHSVPRQKHCCGERLNLTFRRLLRAPAPAPRALP